MAAASSSAPARSSRSHWSPRTHPRRFNARLLVPLASVPPRPLFLFASAVASPAPSPFFRSDTFGRVDDVFAGAVGRAGGGFRKRSSRLQNEGIGHCSSPGISPLDSDDGDNIIEGWGIENDNKRISFLAKLAIALGICATITVLSIYFEGQKPKLSFGYPFSVGNSSIVSSTSPVGFTFSVFGYKVNLPEYTPGWIYFWLLMAAGCGLFISEEALNIWVGITLARTLAFDGTWKSFAQSFSSHAAYIISTLLWVYWGVCISDMIPFYIGKLFRRTRTSIDICSKLGIGKDKVISITRTVQKYGNMIGFVERFSIGVRNPTSFLAGAWGISSECFFAGVCCGGLITLPIQLGTGFLLRERPVVAVAGVATAVGVWTLFPYMIAASAALFLYLRSRVSKE